MATQTLIQIFNLVSATRHKGLIFSSFTPLSESKAIELDNLLKQALQEEDVSKNTKLRSRFMAASYGLDVYKSLPATFTQSVARGPIAQLQEGENEHDVIGYRQVLNEERLETLKDVQRGLYKTLKQILK